MNDKPSTHTNKKINIVIGLLFLLIIVGIVLRLLTPKPEVVKREIASDLPEATNLATQSAINKNISLTFKVDNPPSTTTLPLVQRSSSYHKPSKEKLFQILGTTSSDKITNTPSGMEVYTTDKYSLVIDQKTKLLSYVNFDVPATNGFTNESNYLDLAKAVINSTNLIPESLIGNIKISYLLEDQSHLEISNPTDANMIRISFFAQINNIPIYFPHEQGELASLYLDNKKNLQKINSYLPSSTYQTTDDNLNLYSLSEVESNRDWRELTTLGDLESDHQYSFSTDVSSIIENAKLVYYHNPDNLYVQPVYLLESTKTTPPSLGAIFVSPAIKK